MVPPVMLSVSLSAPIVYGVGNIRAPQQFLVRGNEILGVTMPAVERNEVARRLHARAIEPTGVDRIAQRQLPVTEVVFTRIAQDQDGSMWRVTSGCNFMSEALP